MSILPSNAIAVLVALLAAPAATVLAQSEWKASEEARALENPVKDVGDIENMMRIYWARLNAVVVRPCRPPPSRCAGTSPPPVTAA